MKTVILILSIAFLASCSAAYKTGQTPDDLYYSKAKVVKEEKKEYVHYDRRVDNYEERQIRLAIANPRFRNLDYNNDYDYKYNPYAYGYNYGYYYNPCYYPYPVYAMGNVTFTNPKNTTIRKANLGGYSNTVTNYQPIKFVPITNTNTRRVYNNSNNSSNNNTQYNTRSNDNDTRTYNPAPSNNSSNNSGGSAAPSGTPVVRPGRGG